MFNYRPAKKQDKAALQSLWEECFPEDKGAFSAWYFTELFQPENVYVAETSTKITAPKTENSQKNHQGTLFARHSNSRKPQKFGHSQKPYSLQLKMPARTRL